VSVIDHNNAVLICAKVKHRLGKVLAETVKRGRPEKGDNVSPLPECLSATEANRKKISSRLQQLAQIPWGFF
jgi:hypothetical protein